MFEIYMYQGGIDSRDLMFAVVRFYTGKFYNDSSGNRKEVTISETKSIHRDSIFFEWRYKRIVLKLIKKLMNKKEVKKYIFKSRYG